MLFTTMSRRQGLAMLFFIIYVIILLWQNNFISKRNSLFKKCYRPFALRQNVAIFEDTAHCEMRSCFEYSRCTPLSGFNVYVYDMEQMLSSYGIDEQLWSSILQAFKESPYFTNTPDTACVYVVVVGKTSSNLEQRLQELQFWNGNGKNHILLNIANTSSDVDEFAGVDIGKAIVVQSSFVETVFQRMFDIIIPPDLSEPKIPTWAQVPSLLPVKRRFMLSFCGIFGTTINKFNRVVNEHNPMNKTKSQQTSTERCISSIPKDDVYTIKSMMTIQDDPKEKTSVNITCDASIENGLLNEWCLCEGELARAKILTNSTFSVIMSPLNASVVSTIAFQIRLFESLKYGAVPVIVGKNAVLPFHELLDWSKAIVFLPKARGEHLHFYLKAINENDILEMRKVGRMFWERYFGSTASIIETMLAVLRKRLLIPPVAIKDQQTKTILITRTPRINETKINSTSDSWNYPTAKQKPRQLLVYANNFNAETLQGVFNKLGDPFHLYPFNPFEPIKIPGALYQGPKGALLVLSFERFAIQLISEEHRPLFNAVKGNVSGPLEENHITEQFTVVMITYRTRRLNLLTKLLAQLKGCPYLNKVVVGWYNPDSPAANFSWPEIGVPLIVLNRTENSLNYRFLPFDVIETDAVLSIDDDADVTHEKLVFGFGVWLENRERLVGYHSRFHIWNKEKKMWMYNLKRRCEMSMILTSPAFFHKYYAYLYSYVMPHAIRDHIDKYMNCEDIAMNFLISHIARKPPIKVTTKSALYGGPGLSTKKDHLNERHQCLNFFEKVYGYMPLLISKYRTDYIAGNVKVPQTKEKC